MASFLRKISSPRRNLHQCFYQKSSAVLEHEKQHQDRKIYRANFRPPKWPHHRLNEFFQKYSEVIPSPSSKPRQNHKNQKCPVQKMDQNLNHQNQKRKKRVHQRSFRVKNLDFKVIHYEISDYYMHILKNFSQSSS